MTGTGGTGELNGAGGVPGNGDDVGQHRLATIVFTDVVGFSALVGEDEQRALMLLRRDLQIISGVCASLGGQALKDTGDGLLMCFTSAEAAVTCAMKVQQTFADIEKNLPPDQVLRHRIGIHLGDVFLSSTDVHGNDVNIAARLLKEAEPNGICISQTVYDVVKNKTGLRAMCLGPRELKNIRDAVPVYKLLLAGADPQQPGNGTALLMHVAGERGPVNRQVIPPRRGRGMMLFGGAVILALAACFTVWQLGLFSEPRPTPPPQPSPSPSSAPRGDEVVAVPGKAVDLLRREFVTAGPFRQRGNWQLDGNGLSINSTEMNNKLTLPVVPDGDYDLHVRFKRVEGTHDVVIYIPYGGRQTSLQFGYNAEVDLLATTYEPTAVSNTGEVHDVIVSMRAKDGGVHISVALDGVQKYLQFYEPTPANLKPFHTPWQTRWPQAFGLGSDVGHVEFLAVSLEMKSGNAVRLKP